MLLFSHLEKIWRVEASGRPCVLSWQGRLLVNLHISAYHAIASLCQAFLATKQVSSNAWFLTSFCEISLMPRLNGLFCCVCFGNQLEGLGESALNARWLICARGAFDVAFFLFSRNQLLCVLSNLLTQMILLTSKWSNSFGYSCRNFKHLIWVFNEKRATHKS